MATATQLARELLENIQDYIKSLGDDITVVQLKHYRAYKRTSNFICAEISRQYVTLFLKLDAQSFNFEEGFSRDVTISGHHGTGNVEIKVHNMDDFERAKVFMQQAYVES